MTSWPPSANPIHQCFEGQNHGCDGTITKPINAKEPYTNSSRQACENLTTILRKALVGLSGVANKKFARGRAMIRRSAQFSASCAAMKSTKTKPPSRGKGARAPNSASSLVNDFRSSAASSSAAAGDASVGGSAAALNQEDMLALRLQQALRRTRGLQKRVGGDHLGCLRVQFRARMSSISPEMHATQPLFVNLFCLL